MPDTESILLENSWAKYEDEERSVFDILGFEVKADTTIFDKKKSEAIDGFIFVSELEFSKSIPSRGMDFIRGMVNNESKSKFKDVLNQRGIHSVRKLSEDDISSNDYTINKSTFSAVRDNKKVESRICVFHDDESYYIVGYADTADNTDEYQPKERTDELVENILED
jgi:hypothetical protein